MGNLPLYKQIIEHILNQIYDGFLRPGDRIPSERELSMEFHVSSITSKNALAELTDKGYIIRQKGRGSFVNNEESLLLIADYANSLCRRSSFQNKTIGLILPTMKTGIDQTLLNALEYELSQTDFSLSLTITRENQESEAVAIEKLRLQGASGIILFPAEHELYNESILRLTIEKYPFVLVDRYLKGIRSNYVGTDNYAITKTAVNHLILKGCRAIVFLSPDSSNTVSEERLHGFRDSLLEHGFAWNNKNLCPIPLTITDPNEKESLITSFLQKYPSIDGILCVNQEMATYVDSILSREDNWENYQVCSFDYFDNPHMSYIVQDISSIAKLCVRSLIDATQGEAAPKQYFVKARFVPSEI